MPAIDGREHRRKSRQQLSRIPAHTTTFPPNSCEGTQRIPLLLLTTVVRELARVRSHPQHHPSHECNGDESDDRLERFLLTLGRLRSAIRSAMPPPGLRGVAIRAQCGVVT